MKIRLFLLGLTITILILLIATGLFAVFSKPNYYIIGGSVLLGPLLTWRCVKWIGTETDDNDRF